MGGIVDAVFGGSGSQEQKIRPDKAQKEMNRLLLGEMQGLFLGQVDPETGERTGGTPFSTFAEARPDIFQLSPESMEYADRYGSFADAVPELFTLGSDAQRLVDTSSQQPILNIEDYIRMGLDESSGFISQIATPEILQTAALQGLEGGGFVPDAIARATSQIALPFLQSIPGAAATLSGIPGQLAQTADIPRQLQLADYLRQQQVLPGIFGISDINRQLSERDLLRQQGVVTTGLTGIPFAPGQTTTGDQRKGGIFENIVGTGFGLSGMFAR